MFFNWFSAGQREILLRVSQQLGLPLSKVRATMEDMRQQGLLHGSFVGSLCICALKPRQHTALERPHPPTTVHQS